MAEPRVPQEQATRRDVNPHWRFDAVLCECLAAQILHSQIIQNFCTRPGRVMLTLAKLSPSEVRFRAAHERWRRGASSHRIVHALNAELVSHRGLGAIKVVVVVPMQLRRVLVSRCVSSRSIKRVVPAAAQGSWIHTVQQRERSPHRWMPAHVPAPCTQHIYLQYLQAEFACRLCM